MGEWLTSELKVKLGILIAQSVFLFTGIFSTCVAQFVYYEGAGDQRAMLLPLCNYLGMMLVGLMPDISLPVISKLPKGTNKKIDTIPSTQQSTLAVISSGLDQVTDPSSELVRRGTDNASEAPVESVALLAPEVDTPSIEVPSPPPESTPSIETHPMYNYATFLQICVLINVFLDFAGCVFSNIGLSMAGSGVFQVIYSSVVCWSALMSRIVLKKVVSREEWIGIATVTFGLAFSAVGESTNGQKSYIVLIGSINTLIGAAFYGATYVAGEFSLNLPERPQPKELCVKIGSTCLAIIAMYMMFYVLPNWNQLITSQVEMANGSSGRILTGLILYTISQLGHGFTYFLMLGSCGAVTTGIMQSLRAVGVFAFSSVVFCSKQESQCYDTKRGVATLVVVVGVLFYSWAKGKAQEEAKNGNPKIPIPAWMNQKHFVV